MSYLAAVIIIFRVIVSFDFHFFLSIITPHQLVELNSYFVLKRPFVNGKEISALPVGGQYPVTDTGE